MIDVNKITSTLAKLPDAQLQQYAQMHKNDPYIMALAMSESNRRKELRSAGQGDQALQEQPKVVDQEIERMAERQPPSPAEMARMMQMINAKKQAEYEQFTRQPQAMPEELGIGQLPVGGMDFANGGIVAFADEGLVQDAMGTGGSEITSAATAPEGRTFLEWMTNEPQWKADLRRERERAAAVVPPRPAPQAAPEAAPAPKPEIAAAPQAKAPAPSNVQRAEALTSPTTIDALQQKYFGDYKGTQQGLNVKRQGLVQGIKDLAEANLAEDQKLAAERSSDKVYKSREERLAKQEKGLEGLEDRYLGLALLQAGAAMMSTPGGIGAALGKGVSVGADRYAAGLDKINAAQAKFAEARDRLDELRINRDDMNAKQIRESLRQVKSADLRGQEFLLSGLEKDWGIERDMLGKVFSAANEDLQTTRRIEAQKAIAADKGPKDTGEQMKAAVFADLKAKYPNDPAKVAAEFNKTFSKTEDLDTLFKKEQLKALAEAQINAAKTGNVIPGQKEALAAMQQSILGGRMPTSAPNANQVAALKQNPALASEFDKKFGPGAAAQYLK
jgi:hypothetical protein